MELAHHTRDAELLTCHADRPSGSVHYELLGIAEAKAHRKRTGRVNSLLTGARLRAGSLIRDLSAHVPGLDRLPGLGRLGTSTD